MSTWDWLLLGAICFEFVVAPLKIGKTYKYGLIDLLDNLIMVGLFLKAKGLI